ncbi:LOW QUALITY PROTEIN: hypothetical protein RJ640_010443, partial [Escallonia rubra]
PLSDARSSGDVDICKILEAHGGIDHFATDGRPYSLFYCSGKSDKGCVIQELEKGVEPNLGNYDKRTTLHLASCKEVVLLLLEKGADVSSTDRWGLPLSDARSSGHEDTCRILEARGGIDPVGLDSQTHCYEIDHTEVDINESTLIGEGTYGEVYLVKWRGTKVAAKTIRSSIASNQMENLSKKLALSQKLGHPNIVQFLDVLKDSDRLIFLTEYLRNTDVWFSCKKKRADFQFKWELPGSSYDILKKKQRLDPVTAVAFASAIARYSVDT